MPVTALALSARGLDYHYQLLTNYLPTLPLPLLTIIGKMEGGGNYLPLLTIITRLQVVEQQHSLLIVSTLQLQSVAVGVVLRHNLG